MSWMKRPRGSPAPVAGAGQSIFSPLQPPLPGAQSQPNQQPTWMGQQAPLSTPTPTSYPTHAQQQPQEFWQQPQPTTNYNNPPQQTYSQPNYQTHQPPIQNQYPNDYYQYDQQQYASQPPYQPQQNFHTYQNQEYNAPNTAQQPNFQSVQQNQTAAGARQQGAQPNQWETTEADPWDWGWQDDANAQAQQNSNQSHNNSNQSLNTAQQNPNQQSNLAQHGSNQQPNIAQQNLNQQPNPVQQNHQSQSLQTRMANPTQQGHQNIQQAPPANANLLADSFANTANSWNWPAEEVAQPEAIREPTPQMHSRKSSHDNVTQRNVHVQKAPSPRPADTPYHSAASAFAHVDSAITELSQDDNKNIQLDESFSVAPAVLPVSEPNIKTLNDREALMEHNIPNLAMGRRFHADNLTPQWSIESQPSQDSSDGILSHTESSNRSEDPSRSSNKSSPGFNTNDNTNFNYAQPAENAWDHPSVHNPSSLGRVQDNTVNQELVNSVRTLSINRESVSPDKSTRNTQGDHVLPPADYKLPPQVLTPPVANLAQPPNNKSPQLPPSAAGFSSATTPNQNPFKRSGQLSHRNANNRVTPMQMMPTPDNVVPPIDTHPAQISPFAQQELTPAIRQSSPSLVNPHSVPAPARNVQQAYSTANLETTPDNSERPDIPPPVNFRPMQYPHPVHQNTVENFEVAPSNDRNEYLQTGHLSDPAYDNTNFADEDVSRHALQESYSPPGFRRMVVGQPESEFGQNSSFISDEPPPGLSRMVPGQLTDSSNLYTQPNDDYLDRQIDGQTTESSSTYMNRAPTVYRQVDGQPTGEDSNYNQNLSLSRNSSDRRPVGLDRMVPGESSSFNVQTFQSQNFSNAGDERVVPGFGQSNASEPREQNMDGSDYSEVDTNQIRSVVGAVEVPEPRNIILDNPLIQNVVLEPELVQRDLDMEGENLQDLSAISTSEFPMIRDQNMDGADIQDEPSSRTVDILDSGSERPGSQKLPVPNREQAQHSEQKDRKYRDDTTGDESERDRYKNNRKEKERLKSSKERDTRYGDRRDERRTDKDRRGETISRSERERGDDGYRRSNRDAKYETEDTDYYSDKDRRRYREGSYPSGKPPRPENSSRREEDSRRSYDPDSREERDGRRRKNTDPRDSRYDPSDPRYDPRDPRNDPRYDSYESERDSTIRRRDRDKERYQSREERDRRYARDERGYNSLRKNRSGRDDRKRDPRYPPRPDSRDPDPTEDELNESIISKRDRRSVDRDRDGDRSRQPRHRRDRGYNQQYYERYGYSMDPYQQQMYQHQQQTYQYYEKLRLSNPQAYLEIYNKYMAGKGLPANTQQDPSGSMAYGDGYALMPGYESASVNRLGDERGSVHSGRSSANGELKERTLLDTSGNYYYTFRRIDPGAAYRLSTSSLRRRGSGSVHSLHTDHSGSRDFNTDSINLGLENSTVKSERMTPVKFATAHIKGIISSTNLVTINPCYPMDGQPAIVEILDLNKILINDPVRCELTAYPGPLVKGVTHKKTVIEYCEAKIRDALDSLSSPLFAHNQTSHNVHSGSHHNNNSSSHNSHSERPPVVSAASLPANADLGSYVLMWELLILLLRQNGMVVGTDIAELLVKNKRQFEWRGAGAPVRHLSRRGSTSSVTSRSAEMPVEEVPPHQGDTQADGAEDSSNEPSLSARRTERAQQPSLARNAARRTSSNTNILESSSQEKYITDRFREYLLFGSGKEALEWAMSHGLWGHALFLASKMDRRTYANVMTRFANGLAANDPLQTLYQLMSGRQPASVTCVLDEKWGDWRPHLAMILSNTSQRPELDRKSITQLGDTLQSRGDTYGAHFCYLMSREEFHPSRLQLLGLAPPMPAAGRTPSYAIIMTEIYEYACTLSQDNFTLGHFQFYKYLLATRLVDVGLYERALFYMESIANVVAQSPHQYQTSFVERVLEMADRLKHYDPEENVGELLEDTDQYGEGQYGQEGHQGQGRTNEKSWVTTLRRVLNDLSSGAILHEPQSLQSQTPVEYDQPNIQQSQHQNPIYQQQTSTNQQQWNQNSFQQHLQQQQQHQLQQSSYDQFQLQQQQQLEQQQLYKQEDKQQEGLETDGIPQMYDPTVQGGIVAPSPSSNSYIPPISQYRSYGDQHQPQEGETDPQNSYGAPVSSSDSGYWNHDQQQNNYGYEDREGVDALDPPRPQISMPNTARGKSPYDEDQEPADSNSSNQLAPKPADGKKDAPVGKNQSSGWFGGIFNKLSLKPKNQMILPDDKNPSIVWDSDKKKWTNLDADEDEQQTQVGLPPKMSDIMRPSANNNNISYQPQMPSGHTPPPLGFSAPPEQGALPPNPAVPMPNIFKLQKGRHIKKSYVDVFNPSGAPMKPLPPASEVLGASLQSPAPTSYFVPGVSNNNNEGGAPTFYNPANY